MFKIKLKNWQKISCIFIVAFLLITVTGVVVQESYSRYSTKFDVNVKTTTGEMVCNVEIDSDPSYIENNIAYFKIIVKNTKDDGTITATDVNYKITISNKDGSNGIFYYIDSDGIKSSDSEEFLPTITSMEYSFGKTSEERIFKVFVKVPTNLKETVSYNINLEAIQKQMD